MAISISGLTPFPFLVLIFGHLIMSVKVFGVVGEIGSGKDEVLKYLRARYGIPYISTGDIVRRIAESENIEATRENLEKISLRCFKELGKGCFIRQAAEEILHNGWKIAGISGVRSPDDVEIMKSMFGKDFILIRVDISNPETRFQRVRNRNEERDPITYNQFLEQDKNEENTFHINQTSNMADYALSNDGNVEDLHRDIDALVLSNKMLP
jgi:dephospho-CoA kinase